MEEMGTSPWGEGNGGAQQRSVERLPNSPGGGRPLHASGNGGVAARTKYSTQGGFNSRSGLSHSLEAGLDIQVPVGWAPSK